MSALRLTNSSTSMLEGLDAADWKGVLDFCDRAQLTLLLGRTCRPLFPDSVCRRIDTNIAGAAIRRDRLLESFFEMADSLEERRIDYLLLKGFSHAGDYASDPAIRPQYDLDLYAPHWSIAAASNAIMRLGYEPLSELADFPTDHLPVMVRKTGWQWRGDFFDPDIPVSVDLHHRFWDKRTERLDVPGVEDFWDRRACSLAGGRFVPALHPVDEFGYRSLHALRHLFRGSLRIYHIYELAYFLDERSGDTSFWDLWRLWHRPELRRLEGIIVQLAHRWFDCRLAPSVEQEAIELDCDVRFWMDRYATAPIETLFQPNKSELWLHLSLLDASLDRWQVMRRRLVPLRPPGPVDSVFVPENQMTPRLRLRKKVKYVVHITGRVIHHARTLAPALGEGLTWLWRPNGGHGAFAVFLLAANTYNFGLFIFFLLYNLYLGDLGFREDSLGLITAAMTAGTVLGSVPAAAFGNRFGLKRSLLTGCLAAASISAARIFAAASLPAVLVSAFFGGLAWSIWMVALPPIVAHLTTEKARPLGFSIWLGSGIATGIAGGIIGGRLPATLIASGFASAEFEAKRLVLLLSCGVTALAVVPLLRLRLPETPPPEQKTYPSTSFLRRYLLAAGAWYLALGAFNPFFNVYFAKHLGASIKDVGLIFAGSQASQVAALLLAPAILRRFGLGNGVALIQTGTAFALAAFAAWTWPGAWAALIYAVYMSFQVMTEPGMFSLLMTKVQPAERSGASGLNFLVMSGCQALAAALAGWAITVYGYPGALSAAATMAVLSACLFRFLVRP